MALAIALLALAYGNCGRINDSLVMDSSTLGNAMCDSRLRKTFSETYHPFLTNHCSQCHSGSFANPDVGAAYRGFMSRSLTTIDAQSVKSHGGNSNSPALQPEIDAFKSEFTTALATYQQCRVSDIGVDFTLSNKNLPELPAHDGQVDSGWQTLEWKVDELSVPSKRGAVLRAFFKIQVRAFMASGSVAGLQLRHPKLTLHSGQTDVKVKSLKVYIDNEPNDLISAYNYLDTVVQGTGEVNLEAGGSTPQLPGTFDTDTLFSVKIEGVSRVEDYIPVAPVEPEPVDPGLGLPTRVTFTDLSAAGGTENVFQRSCVGCHNAGSAAGALNLQDYRSAQVSAQNIRDRMNDALRPMPPAGILDQRSRGVVEVWLSSGAPEN